MTEEEIAALADRTVALSESYRQAAHALMNEAQARWKAGTLKREELQRIYANYGSIVQKALDVNNAAVHELAAGLGASLDAVEQDTAKLVAKTQALQRTEDLVALSLKLLVAVGAVALAVIAPNPASAGAAVAAIADAVVSIVST
jgi:hypothetical protein